VPLVGDPVLPLVELDDEPELLVLVLVLLPPLSPQAPRAKTAANAAR